MLRSPILIADSKKNRTFAAMGTNHIKKLLVLTTILLTMTQGIAANPTATHFLGFSIDGPKEQMIQNIQSKGYVYNRDEDYFTGIYYGHPVYIFVKTTNDVVSRIIVYDIPQRSAEEIKARFNDIYGKYQRNDRYIYLLDHDAAIPAKEDIAYEMRFHSKRYRAVFGQMRTNASDSITVQTRATRPSEMPYIDMDALKRDPRERRRRLHATAMSYANEAEASKNKNQVWFTISEKFGKFGLVLFYDNINNLLNK